MNATHRRVAALVATGAAGLLVTPSASAAEPSTSSVSSSGVSGTAT